MPSTTTKRKSTATGGSRTKKARKEPNHSIAKDLVGALLTESEELTAAEAQLLAAYARYLEIQLEESKPKEQSAQEIKSIARTLRSVCVSGIKKQMTVL